MQHSTLRPIPTEPVQIDGHTIYYGYLRQHLDTLATVSEIIDEYYPHRRDNSLPKGNAKRSVDPVSDIMHEARRIIPHHNRPRKALRWLKNVGLAYDEFPYMQCDIRRPIKNSTFASIAEDIYNQLRIPSAPDFGYVNQSKKGVFHVQSYIRTRHLEDVRAFRGKRVDDFGAEKVVIAIPMESYLIHNSVYVAFVMAIAYVMQLLVANHPHLKHTIEFSVCMLRRPHAVPGISTSGISINTTFVYEIVNTVNDASYTTDLTCLFDAQTLMLATWLLPLHSDIHSKQLADLGYEQEGYGWGCSAPNISVLSPFYDRIVPLFPYLWNDKGKIFTSDQYVQFAPNVMRNDLEEFMHIDNRAMFISQLISVINTLIESSTKFDRSLM